MSKDKTNLGGWAIGEAVYNWIVENIPAGSIIIELGSGSGSHELGKLYRIFCVEHDLKYVGLYDNINYIYAPILDGWYDPQFIALLPNSAALLIIDAPPAVIGRGGFLKYSDLFNTDIPILVDDTNRAEELQLAEDLSVKHNKSRRVVILEEDKSAIVLL